MLYNGQVLTPKNGQYEIEVPTGYKFGDKIEGLEYKSGEQRHGNVTITVTKETGYTYISAQNY